jgi:pimeloyl-ACP methyl ester carboxylesterase
MVISFLTWAYARLRNTLRSYYRPLNTLDVILIGHSMGGSLASEAIILLSRVTFQHNIIAIIGLDVPFLGVHPHVVTSGIAGLVKSGVKPPEKESLNRPTADASTSQLSLADNENTISTSTSQTSLTDTIPGRSPSQQPPPVRTPSPQPPPPEKKSDLKETFTKAVQAIYRNRHDLGGAAPRYLWSHIEYGHILLDPMELKAQYDQLRQLPVHFANFYTCIPSVKNEEDRVFCSLPWAVARDMNGWESVEMPEYMDEPTAHSAIFVKEWFPGYDDMIEKIVAKVVSWETKSK